MIANETISQLLKSVFLALTIGLASLLVAGCGTISVNSSASNTQVVPINWSRFNKTSQKNNDLQQSREILANATRYNLSLITNEFKVDEQRGLYVIDKYGEHTVRPPASVCYGVAVALKCAKLNHKELGISRRVALKRVKMLIKGVAAAYKSNRTDGKGWGYQWQSAYWATFVGQAAWMLWDQLDAPTRQMVQTLVVDEADRFIAPGYQVPYWTAPDGHVNTPGDTKAEENAWNADLLQLAVAMMPRHPNVEKWKRICSELMISAYSMKKDLQSDQIMDGKPVKDWLHGFNVFADGSVVNHHVINPVYIMDIELNARTFLTQSLADQPASQAAEWNSVFIYQSLAKHVWPSPPYKPPGGTIYEPGKATIYCPQGWDWSKVMFHHYYLTDVFADVLGWDQDLKYKARDWMRIRASRILAMQARHSDGHMFSPGEYRGYPPAGVEGVVLQEMADACLLLWLNVHNAVAQTDEAGRTWTSKF